MKTYRVTVPVIYKETMIIEADHEGVALYKAMYDLKEIKETFLSEDADYDWKRYLIEEVNEDE